MNIKRLLDFESFDLNAHCVDPNTPAMEVLKKLGKRGENAILVVKESKLYGIVTKHDFVDRILLKGQVIDSHLMALNLMSPNPVTITPDCDLEKALELFVNNGFHCLPVVTKDGIICGMVAMEQVVGAIINAYDSLLGYTLDSKSRHGFGIKKPQVERDHNPVVATIVSNIHNQVLTFHQNLIESLRTDLEHIPDSSDVQGLDLSNTSILFCTNNSKSQRVTRMALSSTGAKLDFTLDYERGKELINKRDYQIVIVDKEMINLSAIARDRDPSTKIVLLTFDSPYEYIPMLAPYPYVNNIVSLSHDDYKFSVKGVLNTIRKITSGDIFGIEKYLESGTLVHKEPILGSDHRVDLLNDMKTYLKGLGVTKGLISRVSMVAEELLLNAIYDAPVNSKGEPLYNELDRRIAIKLKKEEQGTFTFACDGAYVGIAAVDPFGSIKKTTVFRYLQSCYADKAGSLDRGKGGAGRGLFMIVEGADLVVFNVKSNNRTEVAAFFAIDKNEAKKIGRSSLHYFTDAA